MSFGKMLRILEASDPNADTTIFRQNSPSSWAVGGDSEAKKKQRSVGPKGQLDFASLYPNHNNFVSFATWYHNSRGNWQDVIDVSNNDQETKAVVDQAMQAFQASKDPTSAGDGLYAKFGDSIQKIVEQKMKEKNLGHHKYTTPSQWTDEDIFGSSSPSEGQGDNSSIAQRLANLEQSYSDLLRQFNDLKQKIA